ncbi:MAG: hypothetical protein GY697_26475, partial [Desulfobacterales bacterium]|nr:hypothetical protein [Desulfobacterales bacterium]
MRRILKYLLAGTLAAVILVAIVIILILGSRWLTASEVARQKIISETVRLTGGDLNYEKLTLHLLPLPHLTALQVKFQIPGKVSLEAAALAIYPDMTALIRGTLRFKDVVIVQPAARVVMPRTTVADAMPSKTFSFGGLKEAGAAIFAALARLGPDLKIKVKDGAVDLVRADKPVLQIARIAMGVDSHEQIVTLDLSCWSQVSGWLKFKGTLDLGTRDSDGRLKLEALDVRALPTKLPPLAGIRFSDTRLGLEVIFNTRAAEKIQARVACNIPQVRLIRHKKNLVLRNALLKGDFTVDAQKLSWD